MSQKFQPMASQLSKKAALPLAKMFATCRNNVGNTGPSVAMARVLHNISNVTCWSSMLFLRAVISLLVDLCLRSWVWQWNPAGITSVNSSMLLVTMFLISTCMSGSLQASTSIRTNWSGVMSAKLALEVTEHDFVHFGKSLLKTIYHTFLWDSVSMDTYKTSVTSIILRAQPSK